MYRSVAAHHTGGVLPSKHTHTHAPVTPCWSGGRHWAITRKDGAVPVAVCQHTALYTSSPLVQSTINSRSLTPNHHSTHHSTQSPFLSCPMHGRRGFKTHHQGPSAHLVTHTTLCFLLQESSPLARGSILHHQGNACEHAVSCACQLGCAAWCILQANSTH